LPRRFGPRSARRNSFEKPTVKSGSHNAQLFIGSRYSRIAIKLSTEVRLTEGAAMQRFGANAVVFGIASADTQACIKYDERKANTTRQCDGVAAAL